jgi:hypothetical protein
MKIEVMTEPGCNLVKARVQRPSTTAHDQKEPAARQAAKVWLIELAVMGSLSSQAGMTSNKNRNHSA